VTGDDMGNASRAFSIARSACLFSLTCIALLLEHFSGSGYSVPTHSQPYGSSEIRANVRWSPQVEDETIEQSEINDAEKALDETEVSLTAKDEKKAIPMI
jgi:hypothetical protein